MKIRGLAFLLGLGLLWPNSALSQTQTCPTDVETLTSQLLQDLPNYANRVIQRARRMQREVDTYSYVLIAGQAEFEPLSLGPGEYRSLEPTAGLEPPPQIFFTTLERQYFGARIATAQNYHWLFLAQTQQGWRVALVFTRQGSFATNHLPLPPRETSRGVIGQAINLWLRDCRAGTLRSRRQN